MVPGGSYERECHVTMQLWSFLSLRSYDQLFILYIIANRFLCYQYPHRYSSWPGLKSLAQKRSSARIAAVRLAIRLGKNSLISGIDRNRCQNRKVSIGIDSSIDT
jgi:hypothetical protein